MAQWIMHLQSKPEDPSFDKSWAGVVAAHLKCLGWLGRSREEISGKFWQVRLDKLVSSELSKRPYLSK